MGILDKEATCAVIGYGSWATAIVKILLENQKSVWWYIRNNEVLEYIKLNKSNPRYLRDIHFYTGCLHMSDNLDQVVAASDIIVLATPSAFLKSTLEPLKSSLKDKFIVSAIKGIVPGEYITVAEYMNQHYDVPFAQIGILTGPCHAEEVALQRLSYLTVVCKELKNAEIIGEKIKTPYINVTLSTDIYGTEYAAVIKNIYAIAVGIALGVGYGDNFLAVLISNAAIEMNRFINQTYPAERETSSSAYLGDLLVTSYSQFSRNRTFGLMVGKGYSVKSAQIEMSMIAEGYYASECIMQINKRHNIQMPIAECVHSILYGGIPSAQAMKILTTKLI